MMRRIKSWAAARLAAFILVAVAAIYSVEGVRVGQKRDVHDVKVEQQRDCEADARLRDDLVFVLKGAGGNERIQTAILMRLGNDAERQQLRDTFEPGLADAIKRISDGGRC